MEIETKYALSEIDFQRVSIAFAKRLAANLFKKDSYYTRYSSKKKAIAKGEPLIRIREENGTAYLTLKRKDMKNGFESNEEFETKVDNIKVVESLLFASGYHEYFYKEKDAWSLFKEVSLNEDKKVLVHMELEKVNGQYLYLELEVTDDDISEKDAASAIKIVADEFNLTDNMKDNRTWPEILGIKV